MAILVILCIVFVASLVIAIRLFSALKKDPLVLASSIVPVENIHNISLSHQASSETHFAEMQKLQQDFNDFRVKKEEDEKHLLSMVDQLKQENHLLLQTKENAPLSESEPILNEETLHLRAEVSALRGEVQASHQERDQAIQDKEALKNDFDRKIQEAQHSLLSAEDTYKEKILLLQNQIDQQATMLQNQNATQDSSAALVIEEEKTALMAKNEALQQELTKSRVQISGLQRMCENLQTQVQQEHSQETVVNPEGLKLRGF